MEKKVLIAVDNSRHSRKAIQFAAKQNESLPDMKFTLLHIQPTISQYLQDEAKKNAKARIELEQVFQKNSEDAQEMLKGLKDQMVKMGISDDAIQLTNIPRMKGIAKDILENANGGAFDAVILGRRGISGLEEMFMGSVSANVVANSEIIPIWLIDDVKSSKDVMLAVDGSETSLRALDHLSFVYSKNTDANIMLFHVRPKLKDYCPIDFEETQYQELSNVIRQEGNKCVDQFFAIANEKFKAAGIPESRINLKTVDGVYRVGKVILDEFKKGDWGTLVIGRRGMDKKNFIGSAGRYLINHFSNGALWVVP